VCVCACVGRSALTTLNVMASQVNVIADGQTSAACMAAVHCSVSFTVKSIMLMFIYYADVGRHAKQTNLQRTDRHRHIHTKITQIDLQR